ncbi:hypothetical protein MPC1_5460004 [Methylocella tundrae]|nr:hypothetical protein MPC1_5460004 [Methylocella tundrae]
MIGETTLASVAVSQLECHCRQRAYMASPIRPGSAARANRLLAGRELRNYRRPPSDPKWLSVQPCLGK